MSVNEKLEKCNILGVDIDVTDMDSTVEYIKSNIENLKGDYICVSNVHTTVMSYEDSDYKNIQNSGAMALPDGKPLSIISKKRGYLNAKRVTGPELMVRIMGESETLGYKHFFYGSTDETLELLQDKIKKSYPKLNLVGVYSPPFRELSKDEEEDIINIINNANPDFVWVGLGAPKQERWMFKHKNRINGLMIGVGAAFDYYAGNIKRAPKWMQDMSLEWLYRLMQDPKRLWKRYFSTNLKFLYLIIRGDK